ncbi:MAG: hypothetical protein WAM28_05285 [Chlamydiales bacterium]
MSISGDNHLVQLSSSLNQIHQSVGGDQPLLRTTTSRRRRCCSNLTRAGKAFAITGIVLLIIAATGATIAAATCGNRTPRDCYNNPPPGYREGLYTMIGGLSGLSLGVLIWECLYPS